MVKFGGSRKIIFVFNVLFLIISSISCNEIIADSNYSISFEEIAHIVTVDDIYLECDVIHDNLFAISVSNGIKSFDVSDREHPIFLDDIDEISYCHHFEIQNNIAYLAEASFGIKIVNVSNPTHLEKIGQYYPEGDGEIYSLHVADDFIVSSEWHDSLGYAKLQFINITDPTNPTNISTIDDGESVFIRYFVENNLCYATSQNNGLKIFNLTDFEDITEIIHYTELTSPFNFKKIADRLYLADANSFKIFNVSNITNMTLIGEYSTSDMVMDIQIHNSLAFISVSETGLLVLDLSDLSSIQKIGQFNTQAIFSFDFDTHYFYIALIDYGLKIITYTITTLQISNSVIFPGGFLFVVPFVILFLIKKRNKYLRLVRLK